MVVPDILLSLINFLGKSGETSGADVRNAVENQLVHSKYVDLGPAVITVHYSQYG